VREETVNGRRIIRKRRENLGREEIMADILGDTSEESIEEIGRISKEWERCNREAT